MYIMYYFYIMNDTIEELRMEMRQGFQSFLNVINITPSTLSAPQVAEVLGVNIHTLRYCIAKSGKTIDGVVYHLEKEGKSFKTKSVLLMKHALDHSRKL
jgi:hypothetical protein